MNNLINKLKDIHFLGKSIAWVIGFLIGAIWFVFSTYNDFKTQNEELIKTVQTTQQMSLKSVIWNESIPIVERASACDVYLSSGYNSLTKKECEFILDEADLFKKGE